MSIVNSLDDAVLVTSGLHTLHQHVGDDLADQVQCCQSVVPDLAAPELAAEVENMVRHLRNPCHLPVQEHYVRQPLCDDR